MLGTVMYEILGEGIGDSFEDAKRKAGKMKEIWKKVYPSEQLKILYDDEVDGNNVGFRVAKEIWKSK